MTPWHVPPEVLERYVDEPRSIDEVTASSIELHVIQCEQCRSSISGASDRASLEESWSAIADRIDVVRVTPVERVLLLLGFSETHARVVGATRALQLSWLAAMVAVVVASVLLAIRADTAGPFLAVAPVIPLAAIGLAFMPGADPAGEAGGAAPMTAAGLVLRRAIAVLTVSFLVVAIGSVALPGVDPTAAAWVLPALGLSLAALALSTWLRMELVAPVLGGVWFAALWIAAVYEPPPVAVDGLAPLSSGGQLACAVLAVVGGCVVIARSHALATIGRSFPR